MLHRFLKVLVDWTLIELAKVVSDGLFGSLFVLQDVIKEVLAFLSQLRIKFLDICPSFAYLLYILSAHDIIQVLCLG